MTAHRLALASPKVSSASIEAHEFPEMAQAYAVSAVPKIVINDRLEVLGAVPEAVFLHAMRQALGATNGDADGAGDGSGGAAGPAGGDPSGSALLHP